VKPVPSAQRAATSNPPKRPIRRSGEFHRDGKYYLFSQHAVLVIRGWPTLKAWRRTNSGTHWKHVRPTLDLQRPNPVTSPSTPRLQGLQHALAYDPTPHLHTREDSLHFRGPMPAWQRQRLHEQLTARRLFIESFPAPIRSRLSRFPHRQWHLAVLLARCPGAIDLIDSNPALAFALANSWCFQPKPVLWPLRAARNLILKPQRAIAAWLGFPPGESSVRILRKIPPAACSFPVLLRIRDQLQDPASLQFLRHARSLNATTAALLQKPNLRPHLSPRLLDDDFSGVPPDRAHPLVGMLADVVGMFRFLRIPSHTRFRNLAEVQQAHDHLVQQLVEIGINPPNTPVPGRITDLTESLAFPFPSPPVPGSSNILPLIRPIELLQEGREMHHCVGSYIPQVQEGSTYIYRVLAPERATLALHRYDNSWSLGQIYGPFNEPVQPSTREAIRSWLEQARPIPEPSEGSPDWLQFQLDF
jgi:hypothetical protein